MNISSHLLRNTTVLAGVALLVAAVAFFAVPQARAVVSLADIESGDLVRSDTLSAVYYMGADGFRYVFPNDKCYFTWYENFDDVKWITSADMAKIQLGGNVTYKPGVKMIKIVSSPTVYVVDADGSILELTSETQASTLYGTDWNTKIDDVADAFFSNYTNGGSADDYDPSDAMALATSINADKELVAPIEIAVDDSGFSNEETTIAAGGTVRFTNNDTSSHTILADDNSWGTILSAGSTFVKRFTTAGTYTYYDSENDATGAVIVE